MDILEDLELMNLLAEFNAERKEQGLKRVSFKNFTRWLDSNDKLRERNEPPLTYEQWKKTIEEHDRQKTIAQTNKRQYLEMLENMKREKTEFEELQSEYLGNFYFNFYNQLLMLDLAPQYLFRFAYLCAFIDYDCKIRLNRSVLAKEKDLEEILKLKKTALTETKKVFIENELIFINKDKTIKVNPKYAFKGNIRNRDLRGSVKMFEYGIKDIYENSKPSEHKKIGMLMKLLPLMNYDYNVICFNPEESNEDEIIPLTFKDMCKVVGYNENQSSRLKRELLKLEIDGKAVICIHTIKDKNAVSINPHLFYKGHNIAKVRHLFALFNMLDK